MSAVGWAGGGTPLGAGGGGGIMTGELLGAGVEGGGGGTSVAGDSLGAGGVGDKMMGGVSSGAAGNIIS